MSFQLAASPNHSGTLLRGFGHLFWLFFSWRSVVLGCAYAGVALLALTVLSWFNPVRAFSLSLLTFALLLAVPFLAAPPLLRTLIGHRSISMVPHLPLMAGLALLLLTALTALYIPVVGIVLEMPNISMTLAVKLFIGGSLYICVVQWLITSKYGMVGFSLLPALVIVTLSLFGTELLQWLNRSEVLWGLSATTAALWIYALHLLSRRSAFKPPHANNHTSYTMSNSLQGSRLWGFNLARGASPAGTLLLAYPASLAIRLVNIGSFAIMSPLMGTLMLAAMPYEGTGSRTLFLVNTFMMLTLMSGCISSFFYGELGARARMLWLRVGGDRTQLWHFIERELWTNIGLLAAMMGVVVLLSAYFNSGTQPLHYGLIALAYAVFEIYRSLCARLYNWPSLVRALVLLLSLGVLAAALVFTMGKYGVRESSIAVLIPVEAGFVLLALLFRAVARARFVKVDWMVVKHAISKRAMVST